MAVIDGKIVFRVVNRGRSSSPPSRVTLFPSGGDRQTQPVPALSPGMGIFRQFPAPPAGTRFQVMVDPENQIAEANEGNNRPTVMTVPAGESPPPVLVQGPIVKTTSPLRFVGQTAQVSAPVNMTVAALSFTGQSTSLSTPVSKIAAPLTFTGATTDTAAPIQKTTSPLIFVGKP